MKIFFFQASSTFHGHNLGQSTISTTNMITKVKNISLNSISTLFLRLDIGLEARSTEARSSIL